LPRSIIIGSGQREIGKLGQPVFLSREEGLSFLVNELGKVHAYAVYKKQWFESFLEGVGDFEAVSYVF